VLGLELEHAIGHLILPEGMIGAKKKKIKKAVKDATIT
jgi:hypothetical protein